MRLHKNELYSATIIQYRWVIVASNYQQTCTPLFASPTHPPTHRSRTFMGCITENETRLLILCICTCTTQEYDRHGISEKRQNEFTNMSLIGQVRTSGCITFVGRTRSLPYPTTAKHSYFELRFRVPEICAAWISQHHSCDGDIAAHVLTLPCGEHIVWQVKTTEEGDEGRIRTRSVVNVDGVHRAREFQDALQIEMCPGDVNSLKNPDQR